jgi:hypothetical protein
VIYAVALIMCAQPTLPPRLSPRRQSVRLADARPRDSRDHVVEPLGPIASIDSAESSLEICPQGLELRPAVWMGTSLRGLSFGGHTRVVGQSIRHEIDRHRHNADSGPYSPHSTAQRANATPNSYV